MSSYKTYTAIVEFEVCIKDNAMIAQNADSVTAAVRHFVRQMLPTGWRRNGMLVREPTLHVHVEEKEVATNE